MKILIDINVVLDVILERKPWAEDAALLLDAAERGKIEGFVAGHTITTVHYIVARDGSARKAATAVVDLLRIVDVVALDSHDFSQALVLGISDYEDAVQAAAAAKIGASYIATRNEKDFRHSPVAARSPTRVLAMVE